MSNQKEKGVVIVLFAMLVALMVGFMALSAGFYEAASTKDSTRSFAQVASLSALEAYFRSSDDTEADRRLASVQRVKEILTAQYNEGDTLLHHDRAFNVIYDYAGDGVVFDPLNPNPDKVILQGGRYFFEPDPGMSCGESNSDYPCFVREINEDQPINAFKVFGGLSSYEFGGFVRSASEGSVDVLDVKTLSVSSVVPRIGCFIVDLSPSIINESHLSKTLYSQTRFGAASGADEDGDLFLAGHGSKNAYLLSSDNPGVLQSTYDDPLDCGPFLNDYNAAVASNNWGDYKRVYNRPGNSFSALECLFNARVPVTEHSSTRHFASDYIVKRTLGDEDYNRMTAEQRAFHPDISSSEKARYRNGDRGMYYRFQTYPGFEYTPPEPLNTILQGVNFAIDEVEKRAVAGDQICLVFFDERVSWSRTYLPTNDFDALREVLNISKPTGTEVLPDLDASGTPTAQDDPLLADTSLERSIRYGIFPGFKKTPNLAYGPVANFRTGNFSNLPLGISAAVELIADARSDGTPSAGYIAMITDGLSNCGTDGTCFEDTYNEHRGSIDKMLSMVDTELVPASIPLHVMLIGDYIAPHTVAFKDPADPNVCLSDQEVRTIDGMFARGYEETDTDVLADLYRRKSTEVPWYNVNAYMYTIAKRSRGIFAPIRRPEEGVSCVTFEDLCPTMKHMERLLTDPECDDLKGQFERYISAIIGENPYIIAESW